MFYFKKISHFLLSFVFAVILTMLLFVETNDNETYFNYQIIIQNEAECPDNNTSYEVDKSLDELSHILNVDASIINCVYTTAEKYNLDPALLFAVISKESNFNAKVISQTNDYGLMQINKVNHSYLSKKLGITDFLDVEQNLEAGAYMLYSLSEKYHEPHKVLMAYNLGEGGMKKKWSQGIHSTKYSSSIMEQYYYYLDLV